MGSIDVRQVAALARLQLSEDEADQFQEQLTGILRYVDQLSNVDVSDVEPTAHAHAVFNVLREDAIKPGLEREAVLAIAPKVANDLLIVPKVVE